MSGVSYQAVLQQAFVSSAKVRPCVYKCRVGCEPEATLEADCDDQERGLKNGR